MPKIIPKQTNSPKNTVPASSDLDTGELALNVKTGVLYTKTMDGVVMAVRADSHRPPLIEPREEELEISYSQTVQAPAFRNVKSGIREGSFQVNSMSSDEFGNPLGTKIESYNTTREAAASVCAYSKDGTELSISSNGQEDTNDFGGANAASIKYHGSNGLHIGGSLVDAGIVKSDVAFKVEVAVSGSACEATTTFTGNVNIAGTEETVGVASSSGTKGDIKFDSNYLYICVATDTWKRVALASF